MQLNSTKTSRIILFITAMLFSRAMFLSFNDPEGPNLLIITVMAAVVYSLSLVSYLMKTSVLKKLLLSVIIQIVIVITFYICLS